MAGRSMFRLWFILKVFSYYSEEPIPSCTLQTNVYKKCQKCITHNAEDNVQSKIECGHKTDYVAENRDTS